jgi:hypothetical protein
VEAPTGHKYYTQAFHLSKHGWYFCQERGVSPPTASCKVRWTAKKEGCCMKNREKAAISMSAIEQRQSSPLRLSGIDAHEERRCEYISLDASQRQINIFPQNQKVFLRLFLKSELPEGHGLTAAGGRTIML